MISIQVKELTKNYGNVIALDNISFEVNKGELFGFIGPDGAGKTTLFRILVTLLIQDKGTALMEGHEVVKEYKKIRNMVGYMPGRFSLYQDLSVEENLKFFATTFGTSVEENYDLIKDIYQQIEPFKKRLAGKLSGGMKQKLALSCAMIHKPEILILDEPTTGVDAVSRKEFWEMLCKLKENNITILVSTPYMDEASLCDKVALIQNGKILSIDKPDLIMKSFSKPLLAIKANNMYNLLYDLNEYKNTNSVYPFGEYIHYTPLEKTYDIKDIESFLVAKGHINIIINKIEANIEDCFMDLMKKN
ncbi:MAG: ATPase [Bacteroidetes bacterium CG2_30_32_10]|nr:MAG: ATPase [Bacteroidetes bacterium CG2_30_32_10]